MGDVKSSQGCECGHDLQENGETVRMLTPGRETTTNMTRTTNRQDTDIEESSFKQQNQQSTSNQTTKGKRAFESAAAGAVCATTSGDKKTEILSSRPLCLTPFAASQQKPTTNQATINTVRTSDETTDKEYKHSRELRLQQFAQRHPQTIKFL